LVTDFFRIARAEPTRFPRVESVRKITFQRIYSAYVATMRRFQKRA
jgi:hypothetical protein